MEYSRNSSGNNSIRLTDSNNATTVARESIDQNMDSGNVELLEHQRERIQKIL